MAPDDIAKQCRERTLFWRISRILLIDCWGKPYFDLLLPRCCSSIYIIEHHLASFFEGGQHSLHHFKHGRREFMNVMDDPVVVPEVLYAAVLNADRRDLYPVLR